MKDFSKRQIIILLLSVFAASCMLSMWFLNPPDGRKQDVRKAAASSAEEAKDHAIRLAEKSDVLSHPIGYYKTNADTVISSNLKKLKEPFKIRGWSARLIEQQTYLVVFAYETSAGLNGYYFEADLSSETVRLVAGDSALEQKYGLKCREAAPKVCLDGDTVCLNEFYQRSTCVKVTP